MNRETDQAGSPVAGNGPVAMNVESLRGGQGQERCQAEYGHPALERGGAEFAVLDHADRLRWPGSLSRQWSGRILLLPNRFHLFLRPLRSILIVTKQLRVFLALVYPTVPLTAKGHTRRLHGFLSSLCSPRETLRCNVSTADFFTVPDRPSEPQRLWNCSRRDTAPLCAFGARRLFGRSAASLCAFQSTRATLCDIKCIIA